MIEDCYIDYYDITLMKIWT